MVRSGLALSNQFSPTNDLGWPPRPLYDPIKDLDPSMQIAVGQLCFAVHPSMPAKTLDELVAYVKANPGKVSYGHAGIPLVTRLGLKID